MTVSILSQLKAEVEHHRKKVRFFSTAELVVTLEQEKAEMEGRPIAESRLIRCIPRSR